MKSQDFIITKFNNIFTANDAKGKCISFRERYCACFIVTLRGSIRFTYNGGSMTADSRHPVFLPKGLTYTNECLEDAISFVFNFHTLEKYEKPFVLSPVSHRFATEKYRAIERILLSHSPANTMLVLCQLYDLASSLFAPLEDLTAGDITVKKATEYICSHYSDPTLTIPHIARECFVSEIYLRKLFAKKLGTTPFRYLTQIRMTRARDLIREKRPVKEIAAAVGFADIYQFSRAYKKHFGYPPSETVEKGAGSQ